MWNVLQAGFDTPRYNGATFAPTGYMRAAKLVTPFLMFPYIIRSVWAFSNAGEYRALLSTADLLGYEDPVFFFWFLTDLPFPYGYEVIADDVPLT